MGWGGEQCTALEYDRTCQDLVTTYVEHVCREANAELSENAQLIVRRTKLSSKGVGDKQLRQGLMYKGDPAV